MNQNVGSFYFGHVSTNSRWRMVRIKWRTRARGVGKGGSSSYLEIWLSLAPALESLSLRPQSVSPFFPFFTLFPPFPLIYIYNRLRRKEPVLAPSSHLTHLSIVNRRPIFFFLTILGRPFPISSTHFPKTRRTTNQINELQLKMVPVLFEENHHTPFYSRVLLIAIDEKAIVVMS